SCRRARAGIGLSLAVLRLVDAFVGVEVCLSVGVAILIAAERLRAHRRQVLEHRHELRDRNPPAPPPPPGQPPEIHSAGSHSRSAWSLAHASRSRAKSASVLFRTSV